MASFRREVLADNPQFFWILGPTGTATDLVSGAVLTAHGNGAVRLNQTGALQGYKSIGFAADVRGYLDSPDATAIELNDALGPFWLEVGYARDVDVAGNDEVLFAKADPSNNFGYGLQVEDSSNQMQLARVGGSRLVNTSATVPADGTFHAYGVSRKGAGAGNTLMYVDGVEGHTDLGGIGNTIDDDAGHLVIGASDEVAGLKGPLTGRIAYIAGGRGELPAARFLAHKNAWTTNDWPTDAFQEDSFQEESFQEPTLRAFQYDSFQNDSFQEPGCGSTFQTYVLAQSGVVGYWPLNDAVVAESTLESLAFPGADETSPGTHVNRLTSVRTDLNPGDIITVRITSGFSSGNVGVFANGSGENHFDASPSVGDHTWMIKDPGTGVFVYSYSGGSYDAGLTGAGSMVLATQTAADAGSNAITMRGQGTAQAGALRMVGNSFSFNGSQYLMAADRAALDLGDVVTVVAFFKTPASFTPSTYYSILSKGSGAYYFRLGNIFGHPLIGGIRSETAEILKSVTDLSAATTYMGAWTKTGATNKVYINGVDDSGAVSDSTLADNSIALTIAADDNGVSSDGKYQGQLSDVILFSRALSSTEIANLYAAWQADDTTPCGANVSVNAGAATGTGAAYGAAASIAGNEGVATGTGAVGDPTASLSPSAGNAAGTGAAFGSSFDIRPNVGLASGTGAANTPTASVKPNAGLGSGTGAAFGTGVAISGNEGVATGSGAAGTPAASLAVNVGAATGTGAAFGAGAAVSGVEGVATGSGAVGAPTSSIAVNAGIASGTGAAYQPTVLSGIFASAGVASGTGAAYGAASAISGNEGVATGSGAVGAPSAALSPNASVASGTGTAYQPTVTTSGNDVTVNAGLASGIGQAFDPTFPSTGGSGSGGTAFWNRLGKSLKYAHDHPPKRPQDDKKPRLPKRLPEYVYVGAGIASGVGEAYDPKVEWDDDETAILLLLGVLDGV